MKFYFSFLNGPQGKNIILVYLIIFGSVLIFIEKNLQRAEPVGDTTPHKWVKKKVDLRVHTLSAAGWLCIGWEPNYIDCKVKAGDEPSKGW